MIQKPSLDASKEATMNNQEESVKNCSQPDSKISNSSKAASNSVLTPPPYPDAVFTYIEALVKEQRFEEAEKAHRQFLNFVKNTLHSYVNRLMYLSRHQKNRVELPPEVTIDGIIDNNITSNSISR